MKQEEAKQAIVNLEMLLHYHERIFMSGIECYDEKCPALKHECRVKEFFDPYAEALREAIRCIKLVNRIEG